MKIWKVMFTAGLALSVMACNDTTNKPVTIIDRSPGADAADSSDSVDGEGGAEITKRIVFIKNDVNATTNALLAASDARPGDVIQFDCGYYELTSGLTFNTTEDIIVEGCGMDKTVLSFKNSSSSEGVLVDNVYGFTLRNLTVIDTPGDGVKLKSVNHGTLDGVRTMWSSGRGLDSEELITADNYLTKIHVECTAPPALDPETTLGQVPGANSSSPDYTPSRESGRYGIYPVASRNILVKNSESIGASDAGIYVGQTSIAVIENSRAAYNVMGLEIENVQSGEYRYNLAECNSGGFLIYDLDNLNQYGYGTVMHNNISRNNNTYNFNSGGFVGNVPSGSGMITLSYDRIDMYDNVIENNNTAGIVWASYELFPEGMGRPDDMQIDWYTEGFNIYNNTFRNNGNSLQVPDIDKIIESQGADIITALPFLMGIKNVVGLSLLEGLGVDLLEEFDPLDPSTWLSGTGVDVNQIFGLLTASDLNTLLTKPWTLPGFRGAHIAWDGLQDDYHADCSYPTYEDGDGNTVPVPEATYVDGKPEYNNSYGQPECMYNGYKFDAEGERKLPEWLGCIDDTNKFSTDSIKFVNFHGLEGLELIIEGDPAALDPIKLAGLSASNSLGDLDCDHQEFTPIPLVVFEDYEPSGIIKTAPTEARITELCTADNGANANFEAALEVDCPTLSQLNLFSDATDPRSTPNSNGMPYSLNSKLFSDYAVKYRIAYMPPNTKADYRSAAENGANSGINWPVGTILAKTFAFPNEDTGKEEFVETRVLIKRENLDHSVYWTGMAYRWNESGDDAVLAKEGDVVSVSWKFHDTDSDVLLEGSTNGYAVPNANQCTTCHGNDDVESGTTPIGPKVRNINRTYKNESPFDNEQAVIGVQNGNQIEYLCKNNLMTNCPTNKADYEAPVANYSIAGSSGEASGSDADIESRARAYLEINCAHCHNLKGNASNTGLYFDVFREVDSKMGICKAPTAAGGEGSGGHGYDIVPGNADSSIVTYRIGHGATTPAARMPPIARSVVHEEGLSLVKKWINDVIVRDESKYGSSTNCGS
jgi:uncharacterized repeat protein (TIGR03806 family)